MSLGELQQAVRDNLLRADGQLNMRRANDAYMTKSLPDLYREIKASFPEYTSLKDKLYAILHGDYLYCNTCGGVAKFPAVKDKIPYCSKECAANSPVRKDGVKKKWANDKDSILESRRKTNREKYGVEHVWQNPDVRKKVDETVFNRYGVHNCSQAESVKRKKEATLMANYGVTAPSRSPEIAQKARETMMKEYGVEYPTQSPEIREKAIQTSLERYGVDHPAKSPEVKEKARQTNLRKYNVEWTAQSEEMKLKVLETKTERKRALLRGYGIDPDGYDLSRIPNINPSVEPMSKEMVEILLGIRAFDPVISNRFFCQKTEYVLFLREYLDELGVEYVTNKRTIISPKELDIYIPEKRLAIEVNGIYWHSSLYKEKTYHYDKYVMAREIGIRLLQFTDQQIDEKFDIVKSIIRAKLGLNEKIHARRCKVVKLTGEQAREFHQRNHLDGYVSSAINYGLEYNNELVMAISLSKSRFNKRYDYELTRMSTKMGNSVTGGFSRLLSHFRRDYSGKICSYANCDISTGNSYEKVGFKFVRYTGASLKYVDNTGMVSRHKYQKHKLKEMFDDYNGEPVNEFLLTKKIYGYWSAGNLLYEL